MWAEQSNRILRDQFTISTTPSSNEILIQQAIAMVNSICQIVYHQNSTTSIPHAALPSMIECIVVDNHQLDDRFAQE
jgi:hypothetical protein